MSNTTPCSSASFDNIHATSQNVASSVRTGSQEGAPDCLRPEPGKANTHPPRTDEANANANAEIYDSGEPSREEFVKAYTIWYRTVIDKWTQDLYRIRTASGRDADLAGLLKASSQVVFDLVVVSPPSSD
jgi:hypothetical protein